jgi:hypothetical protein
MKHLTHCALLLCVLTFTGCVLPIPHRRLHHYGVSGRIIDSASRAPVKSAQIQPSDHPTRGTVSRADGSFTLEPVYGWHGAYTFGVIGVSLFPGFDVPPFARTILISANGYQTSTVPVRSRSPHDWYIRAGDLQLKRQP